jgi:lysozyme
MLSQALEIARRQILSDEGLRLTPYRCTAGKLTIGVGHNLDDLGLTHDQVMGIYRDDLDRVTRELIKALPWCEGLNGPRQAVLMNMAFQLGLTRLLSFRRALAHMRAGLWSEAAKEMRDSKWAKEDAPARAARMIAQMETGEAGI